MSAWTAIATRRLPLFAIVTMATSIAAWRLGTTAFDFYFEFTRPRVRLPHAEVCGLGLAVVGAVIMRSRIWQWERVAGPRSAFVAGLAALAGCLGPVGVVAFSLIRIPGAVPPDWPLSNALAISALVFLLGPLLSPILSGTVVVLGYLAVGIVRQMWLDLTWLPIATLTQPALVEVRLIEPRPHWLAAILLLILAVGVQAKTRGQTAWIARLIDRDD